MVCRALGYIASSLVGIVFLLSLVGLSSCTLVPGMHMRNRGFSPSVNQQDEIVTPKINFITPALIQTQRAEERAQRNIAAKTYQIPQGFSTDTAGYVYHVGPQDVLQVVVWDHPNLTNPMGASSGFSVQGMSGNAETGQIGQESNNSGSRSVAGITVDAAGNIFYPYVGVVHVAGMTTDEIRNILTQKLSVYLKNPQLNVVVVGFNSQKVDITGAVKNPTVIPITNVPLSVLNAVTLAGGPIRCGISLRSTDSASTTCADVHNVEVVRGGVTTTVNLDSLRSEKGTSTDWVLHDGDTVFVPNNNYYRVFILGAVNIPGPYNMTDNQMDLREAIGDAGGVSDISDPTYTYVIRNYEGNPKIFEINARSPDVLNLAGDFALKPEDVVFVSTSKLENFNAIINQFLPSLSTAVYIKSLAN